MKALDLARKLRERLPDVLAAPSEFRSEVTMQVIDAQYIKEVCRLAKQEFGFSFLLDIAGVDNLGEDSRWSVVYELYALEQGCHLRLKAEVSEEESQLPSVSEVWATANWHEREVYDMLGIRFVGHPDLRRILMWEGYPFHPLRKDFPLGGRPSETMEVAFSREAPLAGGPFVTVAGEKSVVDREPRARGSEVRLDEREI